MDRDRYIIDLDTNEITKEYSDCLIIGSGIAGVFTALEIPSQISVTLITKEKMNDGNTALAQGGIAVPINKDDSPELHLKDTLYAGADLCDETVVRTLVNEAEENINKLLQYGVKFDKNSANQLLLTKEAAHSISRIVHSGDSTGREVSDKLLFEVKRRQNIKIAENVSAVDLICQDNKCVGAIAFDENIGELKMYLAKTIVCSTGGLGQVYKNTTNPEVSTGDGIAMAYRAGAKLMDLEFIQFHPTVLFHEKNKTFLISETVRGEGAVLKDKYDTEFMAKYHEMKDLAPRDVVSRAIYTEMKATKSPNVFLDISFRGNDFLQKRFPNICKTLLYLDLDITKDKIPVSPAQHYSMGGIKVDVNGKSSLNNLFACGECACNGIHGANRLASNSLLEGIVFGKRISNLIKDIVKSYGEFVFKDFTYETKRIIGNINLDKMLDSSRSTMINSVGIVRNEKNLLEAQRIITENLDALNNYKNEDINYFNAKNILTTSLGIITNALLRKESRGAHYREDYPNRDDKNFKNHIVYEVHND